MNIPASFQFVLFIFICVQKHSALDVFDLNPIAEIFSGCLFHVTSFKINKSVADLNQSILVSSYDYSNFNTPVVLSQYYLLNTSGFSYLTYDLVNPNFAYVFEPKLSLYYCAVQLYVVLDNIRIEIPKGFLNLLFPVLICKNSYQRKSLCPYDRASWISLKHGHHRIPQFEKFGVYQVVLLNEKLGRYQKFLDDWASNVDSSSTLTPVKPHAVSNYFVKLIFRIKINPTTKVLNYTIYLVSRKSFSGFKYTKLDADHNLLSNLENVKNEHAPWLVADSDMSSLEYRNRLEQMEIHFENKEISFRNFKTDMIVDIMILCEMYSKTLVQMMWPLNLSIPTSAKAYFQTKNSHLLAVEEETLQFLTCGGIQQGTFSFNGYISAFDKWVWMWFLVLICITSILPILIQISSGLFVKLHRLSSKVVYPVIAYLEQGNNTASNVDRENYLYFLSGAWILSLVVLSNAYKGENITELTAPLSPTKPESYNDLLNKNFSMYFRSIGLHFTYITSSVFGSVPFHNELTAALRFADENNVTKKYRNILGYTKLLTKQEQYEEYMEGSTMFVSKIENCKNVAFVSWGSEIKVATLLLKKRLKTSKNLRVNGVNNIVSVGKEQILSTRKGWMLMDVEYIKPILFKISAMHESGIAKQWKEHAAWRRSDDLNRQFENNYEENLRGLNLGNNVVVVFYVQLILMGILLVGFVVEVVAFYVLKHCHVIFNKICDKFKQQKIFKLVWLKFLKNMIILFWLHRKLCYLCYVVKIVLKKL